MNKNLAYYKKKRTFILFFLLLAFFFLAASFTILWFSRLLSEELIITIFLPLSLGYLVLLFSNRSKLYYYVMNYQYFKMIEQEVGPLEVKKSLYTTSWIKQFTDDGFEKCSEDNSHIMFYKFYSKLDKVIHSGQVIVFILIAKTKDFDFYHESIDNAMNLVYQRNKNFRHVKKQIVLQFKKYNSLDEESMADVRKIINYRNQNQYLIHLTVGYFDEIKKIYALCPKKWFPNKYYHYACKKIMDVCYVRDDQYE